MAAATAGATSTGLVVPHFARPSPHRAFPTRLHRQGVPRAHARVPQGASCRPRRPAGRAQAAAAGDEELPTCQEAKSVPDASGAALALTTGSFDVAESKDSDVSTSGGSGDAGRGNPLSRAFKTFTRWYSGHIERAPVQTKALTSLVGFVLGDLAAQLVTGGAGLSVARCARLGLYGMLLDGPVGHVWYKVLDARVMPEAPQSNAAILTKTALDQLLWAPGMTMVFFVFLRIMEGRPDAILGSIQTQVVPTLLANYLVWPLAHYVSFRFVPTDYRILYNNCISVVWITFLSLLANGEIHIATDLHALQLQWHEHVAPMLAPLLGGVLDSAHKGLGVPPFPLAGGGAEVEPMMLSYESLVRLYDARFAGNPPGPWE